MQKKYEFEYELVDHAGLLSIADQALLKAAIKATETAYAPYSNFKVGAAACLSTGQIVIGSNQESASFPVGICAERTLLNSIGSQYPAATIIAMAVSYDPFNKPSTVPISPCGMCRQSLLDYENRYQAPIKMILAGKTGPVMVLPSAAHLLPFGFDGSILK
ncbi:MAG: cytidine deaminase [Chitinophagia bacterium]|jgi:cytidine deaminase